MKLVRNWSDACREDEVPVDVRQTVDAFAVRLKAQSAVPPVVYYCEWIDRWSMGDEFPASVSVSGNRFEITCFSEKAAFLFADRCRADTQEQQWMANRLRECASSWSPLVRTSVIILIREVLGPSVTDDEIDQSQAEAPFWTANDNAHT